MSESKVFLVIKNNSHLYYRCNNNYYHPGGTLVDSDKRPSDTDPEISISTSGLLKQNFTSDPLLLELIHKSIRPCPIVWAVYTNNGFDTNGKWSGNLSLLPGQKIDQPLLEYRIVAYTYMMVPDESKIYATSLTRLPESHFAHGRVSHQEEYQFDVSMYGEYGYQPLENLKDISFNVVEWINDY